MKDILFCIFASVTLLAAMYIAFSHRSRNSLKSAIYLFSGIAGLLILLNFHLFSLFTILLMLLVFSGAVLFKERISEYLAETNSKLKVSIVSILVISIITAITAALLGAAKWPKFEVINDQNTFNLIFTKYIAVILVTASLISVILSSIFNILRNGEAK